MGKIVKSITLEERSGKVGYKGFEGEIPVEVCGLSSKRE
jgi:hypothetical protein